MKLRYLKYYCCTRCKANHLMINKDIQFSSKELINGNLMCSNCNKIYSVENGIPRFVSAENYISSFSYQWNLHRTTQLDSYTGLPISRNRLFDVTGWPENLEGQMILEAGSGAGRFSEILAQTGAEIFSFDLSSAVEANYENNKHYPNLNIFLGDIYNIPLKEASFDKVLCLGVLQHTPEPERAFKSLVRYVRPGGELIIDVYAKKFTALLHWKYLLRPLTKHMNRKILYKVIKAVVSALLPVSILSRRLMGKIGARLLPIVEYSHLGLPYALNKQWAILDTFDMYSPLYDFPQSIEEVKKWFEDADFLDIDVRYGSNGIIGRGRCPEQLL